VIIYEHLCALDEDYFIPFFSAAKQPLGFILTQPKIHSKIHQNKKRLSRIGISP